MQVTFIFLGLLILSFVFIPLIKTIFSSDPKILLGTFLEEEVRSCILFTLYAGLIATLVGLLLGVPLAYVLARFDFPGKRFIEGVIDVPIVVPHIAAGVALLFVFGREFLLGKIFHFLGIDFLGATPGVVIAMLFVSVPFLINSAKEGFKAVDPRQEKVARTLGASPWQAFFRISLPLARRSIFSGAVMAWARGMSEFAAVIIIAYHPMVISTLIYERFAGYGLAYSQPITAIAILIFLLIFVGLRIIAQREEKA